MSYCRWSSDNFKCDLYCYEDMKGGWTTHVAGARYVGLDTLPPCPGPRKINENREAWVAAYRAHTDARRELPLEPIGLPHDNQTFNDATLEEFRARVVMLKDAGYHVPDFVLESIDAEIAEASA